MNELTVFDANGNLIPDALDQIETIERNMKMLKTSYDNWRSAILEGMEKHGIKKIETDTLVITYVEPTERYTIDTKKLWKDYKDVALECEKVSDVKASVRIKAR